MTREQSLAQLGELILKDADGELVFSSPIEKSPFSETGFSFQTTNLETGAKYFVAVEMEEIT